MKNPILPPVTYPPLDLSKCRSDPTWCKKEITKRLILLLLEYTRSRPLPFIVNIDPSFPAAVKTPPQTYQEPTSFSLTGSSDDGWCRNTLKATWPLARDSASSDFVNSSGTSYNWATQAEKSAGLFYCARSFFVFDLSSISPTATIVSATLSLTTTGPYTHTICVQQGTQSIPLTTADFQAFTGSHFGTKSTSIGLNTITINSAGLAYLQSVFGSSAKLCVREYDYDYSDVEPNGGFGRVGLNFSETANDADKPILSITTL